MASGLVGMFPRPPALLDLVGMSPMLVRPAAQLDIESPRSGVLSTWWMSTSVLPGAKVTRREVGVLGGVEIARRRRAESRRRAAARLARLSSARAESSRRVVALANDKASSIVAVASRSRR